MTRLLAGLLVALVSASASALIRDDRFLAGYLSAVIDRELELEVVELRVEDGVAHVVLRDSGAAGAERVAEVLKRIEGVREVAVSVAGDTAGVVLASAEPSAGEASREEGGLDLLPRHELFDPLVADPREPHFSAAYQLYLDDDELTHVGSANFGETFALLGGSVGETGWQLGMLGAVFSIFDLDAESEDLVNSDFWVGPTLSLRRGRWSSQLRLFHQSSHLGDEYLLRTGADRVNLSYEGVDLLLSGDLHRALRVYAGGGVLVHSHPELHPLMVQGGFELRSPTAFLGDVVRPIAALDIQAREQNDWWSEISTVAGLELSNPNELGGLRLMLLLHYLHGNSPNGQFYDRRVEYLGVGAHLFF